jgi:hypothetical protein
MQNQPSDTERVDAASLNVFGSEPTWGRVTLIPRTSSWRLTRTLVVAGIAAVLAPLVALIPPHAPWGVGVIIGAFVLARNRWLERYTLVGLEGTCPRCGGPIRSRSRTRLKDPHTVPCDQCHHEVVVEVVPGRQLPAAARA